MVRYRLRNPKTQNLATLSHADASSNSASARPSAQPFSVRIRAGQPAIQSQPSSALTLNIRPLDLSTYRNCGPLLHCCCRKYISVHKFLYPLGQPRLIVPDQFCSPSYPTHTRQSTSTHLKQWHLQTGISFRPTTHSSLRMSLLLTTQMIAEDDIPPSPSARSTIQAAARVIPRTRSVIKRASGNNKSKPNSTSSASKTPLTCRYGLAMPVRP